MFLAYSSPNSRGFAAVAQDIGECDYFIFFLQIVQHEFYKPFFQFVTENMPMSKCLCDLFN